MKDKVFISLSGIFFLIFFLAIGVLTLNEPLSRLIRAKDVAPSPLKSFGVVFPQKASIGNSDGTNGKESVKVSVYVRDVNGSVLANRQVKLTSTEKGILIAPSDTQTTNSIGQAAFTVSSTSVGKVKFTAMDVKSSTIVENIPSVEFIE